MLVSSTLPIYSHLGPLTSQTAQEAMDKYNIEKVSMRIRARLSLRLIWLRTSRTTSNAQYVEPHWEFARDAMLTMSKFDERKGATWHCIVGRNFGSFVTHGKMCSDARLERG